VGWSAHQTRVPAAAANKSRFEKTCFVLTGSLGGSIALLLQARENAISPSFYPNGETSYFRTFCRGPTSMQLRRSSANSTHLSAISGGGRTSMN